MTNDDRDPLLGKLFADAEQDMDADAFTATVTARTETLRHRKIVRRICLLGVLALVGIPLQDYGLALSQVLVEHVFRIDNALLAELLAPIDTVGGLLSAMLLALRGLHRRLFA